MWRRGIEFVFVEGIMVVGDDVVEIEMMSREVEKYV